MDSDLIVMIYGAIMGVVGSLLTFMISALFQFWLARREHERRQSEERSYRLRQIHLPTDEEVIRLMLTKGITLLRRSSIRGRRRARLPSLRLLEASWSSKRMTPC